MNSKRDFKGVWIPKEIWLDKNLSLIEKAMLVEISSLDNEDGCFAMNSYFSEFFNVSEDTVSRTIAKLESKGLIVRNVLPEKGNLRILMVSSTLPAKCGDPPRKMRRPSPQNAEHNNTSNNTSNIEDISLRSISSKVQVKNENEKALDSIKERNPQLAAKLEEFLEFRKAIKKPVRKESFPSLIKKLVSDSGGNVETACDIIDQSIANGWQGLFPLDAKTKTTKGISIPSFD